MSAQISHSRTENYLLCQRKDFYSYGLKLRRKKESASLALGSAGHVVLDAFYKAILEIGGNNAAKQRKAFAAARKIAEAAVEEQYLAGYEDTDTKRWTLRQVIEHYLDNEPLVLAGYRVLAAEAEYHIRIDDEITTLFRVDLIVADPAGERVAVDHKIVWDFLTMSDLELLPQLVKYIGALRYLGYNISYGMYNMLRSRKVKEPKLEQLNQTLPLRVSDERMETTLHEQHSAAVEIAARERLPLTELDRASRRVANKMVCQSCSYRLICKTELNGGDTRIALMDYEQKPSRELPGLDDEEA